MAKCDEGYRCAVCGGDVERIIESDLYLRYVIGEVDPETLHTQPDCHIRCHPALAQFIVDDDFAAISAEGAFAKSGLDPQFVSQREQLVTRGWRRLKDVASADLAIVDYPLPEVRDRWSGD